MNENRTVQSSDETAREDILLRRDLIAQGYLPTQVDAAFIKLSRQTSAHAVDPTQPPPPFKVHLVESDLGGRRLSGIAKKDSAAFTKMFDLVLVKEKTDDLMTLEDLIAEGYQASQLYIAFKKLERQEKAHTTDPAQPSSAFDMHYIKSPSGAPARGIWKKDSAAFVKINRILMVKDYSTDYVKMDDLIAQGYPASHVRRAFRRVTKQTQVHENDATQPPPPFALYFVKSKSGVPDRAILKTDEAEFVKANNFVKLMEKTPEYITKNDFTAQGYPPAYVESAFKKLEREIKAHEKDQAQPPPPFALQLIKNKTGLPSQGILKTDEAAFIKANNLVIVQEKTEEQLSREDFDIMGYSMTAVTRGFNDLEEKEKNHREHPEKYPAPPIGIKLARIKGIVCVIDKADTEKFIKRFKVNKVPVADTTVTKYLFPEDIAARGYDQTNVETIFDKISKQQKKYDKKPVKKNKPSVKLIWVKKQDCRKPALALPEDEFPALIKNYQPLRQEDRPPDKTAAMVSIQDIADLGYHKGSIVMGFVKIKHQAKAHAAEPETHPAPPIRLTTARMPKGPDTDVFDCALLPVFLETYKPKKTEELGREKTEDDVSAHEMAVEGGFIETHVSHLYAELEYKWFLHRLNPKTYPAPRIALNTTRNKGVEGRTIPRADVSQFISYWRPKKRHGLPDKTAADISIEDLVAQGYSKKNLEAVFKQIKEETRVWKICKDNIIRPPEPRVHLRYINGPNGKPTRVFSESEMACFIEDYQPKKEQTARPWTDQDITRSDLVAIGFSRGNLGKIFANIKKDNQRSRLNPTSGLPVIPLDEVQFESGRVVESFPRSHLEKFFDLYHPQFQNVLKKQFVLPETPEEQGKFVVIRMDEWLKNKKDIQSAAQSTAESASARIILMKKCFSIMKDKEGNSLAPPRIWPMDAKFKIWPVDKKFKYVV
jgi:hypothetical protein